VHGPTHALVGEAGREAIVGPHGTRIVDKPTVTTLGKDGTEAVVPIGENQAALANNPTNVPNYFADRVSTLMKAGATKTDIHEWLKNNGVDVSIPTCAQFMSQVVQQQGGKIPTKSPFTASEWNTVGEQGYSSDPNAINVAVKQGVPVGQADSHVTVPIPQFDTSGNFKGFIGRGVNQEEHGKERGIISDNPITIGDKKGEYHIMHQFQRYLIAAWIAGVPAMADAQRGSRCHCHG
jgi:hypothetical protein